MRLLGHNLTYPLLCLSLLDKKALEAVAPIMIRHIIKPECSAFQSE